MPKVESRELINADLDKVYYLAKDVEKFPEFMPDVDSVKIIEQLDENTVVSEWVGSVPQFRMKMKWTEKDIWDDQAHTCKFSLVKGDFSKYDGYWTFKKVDGQVEFYSALEYDYNIPLIGPMIKKVIEKLMQLNMDKILQAVKQKAEEG